MLESLERWLAARGFHRLMLHARSSAAGFYEKLGYAATGEQFVEVTIPHVTMEKLVERAAHGMGLLRLAVVQAADVGGGLGQPVRL